MAKLLKPLQKGIRVLPQQNEVKPESMNAGHRSETAQADRVAALQEAGTVSTAPAPSRLKGTR